MRDILRGVIPMEEEKFEKLPCAEGFLIWGLYVPKARVPGGIAPPGG